MTDPREVLVDTSHFRPGPLSLGFGIGSAAVGIGFGALLLCWGISWLWPMRPGQLAMPRIGLSEPKPNEVGAGTLSSNALRQSRSSAIKREVTEFHSIVHGAGEIVTGWQYADGNGGAPLRQYCYYVVNLPEAKNESREIAIAVDGQILPDRVPTSIPDFEDAKAKCRWWPQTEGG